MIGRNQELYDDMIASGHEFVRDENYERFTLGGHYAPYPIGYIRGPWYETDPSPHYVCMIQTENGWFPVKRKTIKETENLAIGKQIEILGS